MAMNPPVKKIVLGVTGSIAAYKAVDLLRLLMDAGHEVRVIQTPASRHFVGAATLQAISRHPVAMEQFGSEAGEEPDLAHIELAKNDLMVIAPATANTLGKMAAGIADNLLLSTYLALDCPVLICPAMNKRMWNHPAVQESVGKLVERGAILVPPASGALACGEDGVGRLAEPPEIFARIQQVLGEDEAGDLGGLRILVSAGGTREPIDSVRYIANRSSGKMGYRIAEAAASRGADVTVVSANCELPRAEGIRYIDVSTTSELHNALEQEFEACDVLIMAAAVSDYSVSSDEPTGKLERDENLYLHLIQTTDIVSALGRGNNGKLKVGFAAEYGAGKTDRAKQKLGEKGLDIIVFNDISRDDIGFGSDFNEITIMAPGEGDRSFDKASKLECAHRILDQVIETLKK